MSCATCGRFFKSGPGCSWAAMYDMVHMQLNCEVIQCDSCTTKYGPLHSNAKPADGDMSPYEGIIESGST